jgi:hypothetical protein
MTAAYLTILSTDFAWIVNAGFTLVMLRQFVVVYSQPSHRFHRFFLCNLCTNGG